MIGELGLELREDARIRPTRFEFWGAEPSLLRLRAELERRGFSYAGFDPGVRELRVVKHVPIDGPGFLAVLKQIVPLARSLGCSYRGTETIEGADQFSLVRPLPDRYSGRATGGVLGRLFSKMRWPSVPGQEGTRRVRRTRRSAGSPRPEWRGRLWLRLSEVGPSSASGACRTQPPRPELPRSCLRKRPLAGAPAASLRSSSVSAAQHGGPVRVGLRDQAGDVLRPPGLHLGAVVEVGLAAHDAPELRGDSPPRFVQEAKRWARVAAAVALALS